MPGSTLTSSASDRIAASAGDSAQAGTYSVVVEKLAQAQKIAGGAIASASPPLGYMGDIRVNGKTVSIVAGDTLTTLRDKINRAGAGVSATILTVASDDHRLLLNATKTGQANAIDLVEASGAGILKGLGLTDGVATAKNAITNGLQSDAVGNSATDIATAYGLLAPASGTVLVNAQAVHLDLAHDSLENIRDRINSQVTGVTASIVPQDVDGKPQFRLSLVGESGAPALQDDSNVLQTLGFLKQGIADERVAAQNATATVDGVSVERATNSVDDVIAGVSMELLHPARVALVRGGSVGRGALTVRCLGIGRDARRVELIDHGETLLCARRTLAGVR